MGFSDRTGGGSGAASSSSPLPRCPARSCLCLQPRLLPACPEGFCALPLPCLRSSGLLGAGISQEQCILRYFSFKKSLNRSRGKQAVGDCRCCRITEGLSCGGSSTQTKQPCRKGASFTAVHITPRPTPWAGADCCTNRGPACRAEATGSTALCGRSHWAWLWRQ